MLKEKIFEMLKTKYKDIGVGREVLEGVATNLSTFVKEETQIEPAVNGAETMLKTLQSYADNRVNTFKNESEKYKKEAEELKAKINQDVKQPPKKEGGEEANEMTKLIEKLNSLESKISGLHLERTSQTLKEQFIQKMTEKKVPESFYGASILGREFAEASKVEELANQVFENYEKFKQDGVNVGFSFTTPPEQGNDPQKEEEALAEQIRKGTKQIVEQSKN